LIDARLLSTYLLIILSTLQLAGCASIGSGTQSPVSVAQIMEMSQDKVPAYEIIKRIRKSGTVYRPSAAQLVTLSDLGVSDPVINYMQRTYLEAVRREHRLQGWDHWTEVDGWWYGGRPYGWPDAWIP
jgi:hypothetical protein